MLLRKRKWRTITNSASEKLGGRRREGRMGVGSDGVIQREDRGQQTRDRRQMASSRVCFTR
jgi:hypothetical protein